MNILITGGSGFLGTELTRQLSNLLHNVIVFSRSESKQSDMKKNEFKNTTYVLGDVRQIDDLRGALHGKKIDAIIHGAAIKSIDQVEENILNATDVNVNGTANVVFLCKEMDIKLIFVSSDKASRPHTAYGATKYVGEELVRYAGLKKPIIVRYGNVLGSTMSVFHAWKKQYKKNKIIKIRNKKMTRFFLTVETAAEFIINQFFFGDSNDSLLKVARLEALNIYDLARYLYPDAIIDIEDGLHNEKTHEEMHPEYESKDHVVKPQEHKELQKWLK